MIITLITTVVAAVFALTVLDQFLEKRRSYQLVWTMGLILYSLASLFQFLREAFGTTELGFRLWYFTGAMLVAAYLGTGSLYLLAPRKLAHAFMIVVTFASVVGGILIFTSTLNSDVVAALPLGKPLASRDPATGVSFFPPQVVIITILMNIYGTFALAGGALYSAAYFALKRTTGHRVVSNLLIFVGALLSAAGGTLDRLGIPQSHALALLLGLVVIYVGFLRSRDVFVAFRVPFLGRSRKSEA